MASAEEVIKTASCDAIHCTVNTGSTKYVCFTRLEKNVLNICASDGLNLWKLELGDDDFSELCDQHKIKLETYLSNMRDGLLGGKVQVTLVGLKLNLIIGSGSKVINLHLYEAKSVEKNSELQSILYQLAEKASSLENKVKTMESELERLRKKQGIDSKGKNIDVGIDIDNKGHGSAKAVTHKQGMSVVNPASKKRKVAKGVAFD